MYVSASTTSGFIDCHVHLQDFGDAEVLKILQRAKKAGVGAMITAGTTPASSKRAICLAEQFPEIFAGVGIHPMDLTGPFDEYLYKTLRRTAVSSEKVVVVSEIGLDFIKGSVDRETQIQAFREQIRLAKDLGLPVVVHSREAHQDVLRVLREERASDVGGAIHYFQGDTVTAEEVIELGFYVSLARPVLHLPQLQQVAKEISLKYIVLETDTFPQPFKNKRENWTEPRHVADIAAKLAELKGLTIEEVRKVTAMNSLRMLRGKAILIERCLMNLS